MIGIRPISQERRDPEPFVPDDEPETDEDMDALCIFNPSQAGWPATGSSTGFRTGHPGASPSYGTLMDTTEQSEGPSPWGYGYWESR